LTDKTFLGKTVVVTGAGGGLGFGIARAFALSGARTILADREVETGQRAAERLRAEGQPVDFEALDVRDPAQCRALVKKLESLNSSISVWVNHASEAHYDLAENLSRQAWEQGLAVVLSGAFYCAQAVAPHMFARGQGVIVNVASVDGYQASEGSVGHSTAEAGLIMLTQVLGVEWAKRGVRVVGVAPAAMANELEPVGTVRATHERRTPMRRLATVAEIAEAVLFLASDEAAYITAETMRVDGGWTAYQLF
jgi:NAD(P)-dependent dehydrogenase (short-subunit alcohol dehydrogenase family)